MGDGRNNDGRCALSNVLSKVFGRYWARGRTAKKLIALPRLFDKFMPLSKHKPVQNWFLLKGHNNVQAWDTTRLSEERSSLNLVLLSKVTLNTVIQHQIENERMTSDSFLHQLSAMEAEPQSAKLQTFYRHSSSLQNIVLKNDGVSQMNELPPCLPGIARRPRRK